MKRTLIIVAAALIGLGLTGATAATVGEVKKDGAERAYEKAEKGTVKVAKKVGKGTAKTYNKAKDGTVKAYEKVKERVSR